MNEQTAHAPTRQRIGRFSQGVERLPESPRRSRRGRFYAGMDQLPESPDKSRRGHFGRGVEQLPARPASLHVGSFGDSRTDVQRLSADSPPATPSRSLNRKRPSLVCRQT